MRIYTVCHAELTPTVRKHELAPGVMWLEFKDEIGAVPVSVSLNTTEIEELISLLSASLAKTP